MLNAMLLLQVPCRNRMGKAAGKGDGCYLQTLLTNRSQCGRADIRQHLEWWAAEQIQGMQIIHISLLNCLEDQEAQSHCAELHSVGLL